MTAGMPTRHAATTWPTSAVTAPSATTGGRPETGPARASALTSAPASRTAADRPARRTAKRATSAPVPQPPTPLLPATRALARRAPSEPAPEAWHERCAVSSGVASSRAVLPGVVSRDVARPDASAPTAVTAPGPASGVASSRPTLGDVR
ncbi:hypothetical protein VM95_31345 [Streptomyces rubellomurinus]|uniref:Uncharacterized protein n=1 Tax=Streptomyces rubellomurinus (strain ATCC 31215) TaxID=359131 RepID=A0A0F2T8I6_STRR3|nr:hypothetical protein VM95_31345 [Streptomyces rubellomurinus]